LVASDLSGALSPSQTMHQPRRLRASRTYRRLAGAAKPSLRSSTLSLLIRVSALNNRHIPPFAATVSVRPPLLEGQRNDGLLVVNPVFVAD
jgi:hypothetical protein